MITKAKVVGAVPAWDGLWRVRMRAPHFPFYLDSSTSYETRAQADREAEKWNGRTVEIRVTK